MMSYNRNDSSNRNMVTNFSTKNSDTKKFIRDSQGNFFSVSGNKYDNSHFCSLLNQQHFL